MSDLKPDDFVSFFEELWHKAPFHWQATLARQVCCADWPAVISLPTAAGKTACIDIALFAVAFQANWRADERTAPRRIFLVVDRRVIVEEAYRRADRLRDLLANATDAAPTMKRVAERLRELGGSKDPLQVYQLRGGIARDETWVRNPLQPAVITSTVDQVGSRLLFRGYGVSEATRPIHAALIGNDSLILLDEAHCSQPFSQTLDAVRRYRGPEWAERPLPTPFTLVQMTATPRPASECRGISPVIFRLPKEDLHPERLGTRIRAPKPVVRIEAKNATGVDGYARFAARLADEAVEFAKSGSLAIAIIVNRVASAKAIEQRLQETVLKELPRGRVMLVVGRMRPIDRDQLSEVLRLLVGSDADRGALAGPVFVVATQCLEVGADYDFDAMVTECASIDALRQRFGRLNRLGRPIEARARIVIRPEDANRKVSDPDPIYGMASCETWTWLKEENINDVGVAALGSKIDKLAKTAPERLNTLLAGTINAPVLLPAHIDCWCQTSPIPVPDPDVGVFLHGPQQGDPEVQVAWRADLPDSGDSASQEDLWIETVSLCPPTTAECMPVPISVFRRWMRGDPQPNTTLADIQGVSPNAGRSGEEWKSDARRVIAWRGLQKSELVTRADQIRPGDTLVLPVDAEGWGCFGHIPKPLSAEQSEESAQARYIDRAEESWLLSQRGAILRLHPTLMKHWPNANSTSLVAIHAILDSPDPLSQVSDIKEHLRGYARELAGLQHLHQWEWLRGLAERMANAKGKIIGYPALGQDEDGNGRCPGIVFQAQTIEEGGSDELSSIGRVPLKDHLSEVQQFVACTAGLVLPDAKAQIV